MAKNLVIVESPAKAKSIAQFLGPDYEVRASMGHVADLPKNGLGVNTRSDFAPRYVIIEKKEGLIDELKKSAGKAKTVFLAPDPDREGEAIAWHLKTQLGLKSPKRAVFNEITKSAVQSSMHNTRDIDMDLVNAQQARRVLDRLVGYKISPLLWRRVQGGTSAGRVQSVALRLIVDREGEIRAFTPEEYWSITAWLLKAKHRKAFSADLVGRVSDHAPTGKEKIEVHSREDAEALLKEIEGATFKVVAVETGQTRRQPNPPYITSTLQQDGANRLHFTPKRTMRLAQDLYEGLDLGDEGHHGLITYMRTDSTRISSEAQEAVTAFIKGKWGKEYAGKGRQQAAKGKQIQDAHEAIRPTDVTFTPEQAKHKLSGDQFKLYQLIWQRFVASFMAPAVFDTVRADIDANDLIFRATGSTLSFPGFYAVWPREDSKEDPLPKLAEGDVLDVQRIEPEQHFTQPPPRYTEASLIKELEERGIGRPSTYVPIVSTLLDRRYCELQQRRFVPTWLGETVCDVLKKHFPEIIDIGFTAQMETRLDDIEEGKREYVAFMKSFYAPFQETVKKAEGEMGRVERPVEETGELCPDCGRPVVIKMGRFGKFYSCSGFPECRYRRSFLNKTGAHCPDCGSDLVERKGKGRGRPFFGCSNYPECRFLTTDRPVPQPCPDCGGLLTIPGAGKNPKCQKCGHTFEAANLPRIEGAPEPVTATA